MAHLAPATDGDTRTRIQRVALDLFTEHGYEATSLREIAERLGVTKAALYYHFKTKDDIITSLVEARANKLDELIAWGETQPRTVETRRELLHRYSDILHDEVQGALMRCFERNQSSMAGHKAGNMMRKPLLRLLDLMVEPDAPLTERIRRSIAIFALHSAMFLFRDQPVPSEEGHAAALEVALELVE
jgi:AcrR family transcriptional regulator